MSSARFMNRRRLARWAAPRASARAAALRQGRDGRVVGGVDQLAELVVGNGGGQVDGVPPVAPRVMADRDGVGIAVAPLGRLGGVAAALHADRAGAGEADERE